MKEISLALIIMLKGMAGVFVVIGVIMVIVMLLRKFL